MAVVRVLVSPDRRWRVDIRRGGQAEIREHGHRRATVWRHELETALDELGVDIADLVED